MKNTLILSALLSISFASFSQTQIIKCIDENGSVTYHNQKINAKGMKCNSTNLATIDQLKSNPISKTSIRGNSTSNNSSVPNAISTQDQEYRDLKRREILMSERSQEQKQLAIVNDMINKANKNDTVQMKQLNNMLQSHQTNINALEKELKIEPTNFNNVVATVIPGLGIPKNKDSQDKPEFQIEGATVIKPPSSVTANKENTEVKKKESTSFKIPDLDNLRGQLNMLKNQRENKPQEDKSQHIEIKRRDVGVNVSKASLDYQPLPTPLSVPDLGVGK